MDYFGYTIAASLIIMPIGSPVSICDDDFVLCKKYLPIVAVDMEIMDKREVNHIFVVDSEFKTDLNILRKRYCELKDAPYIRDICKFPNNAVQLISFNRKCRESFQSELNIYPFDDSYRIAIKQLDQSYWIYDAVRDAKCEFYYITVRRYALKRLQERLGKEDYDAVNLPPHIPIHLFKEIDN